MRNYYSTAVASAFLLFAVPLLTFAQQQPTTYKLSGPFEINFTQLAQWELSHPPAVVFHDAEEKENNVKPASTFAPLTADAKVTQITLPVYSTNTPQPPSPAPVISFNGLLDNGAVIPPDVMGVVGPNHLMEPLNSQYRIFNKTGGTVSTLALSSFWSGAPSSFFFSDPRILYDPINSRWITCIIGQLSTNSHYAFYIAVSKTDDPTGSWFEYVLDTGSASNLPDYPSLGFNTNWVVITDDFFSGGISWNKEDIWVMNRASLYSGTLGTASHFTDNTHIQVIMPATTLDASQTTEYLISDATNSNSGGNGFVKVANITGSVGSPVYNTGVTIGTNHPWSQTVKDAKQKGTSTTITSDDVRFISCIYRNGSVWGSHHVYLPATAPNHIAADLWQIDPSTNTVQQFIRVEDATGATNYYYPSMAVNANNDVVMGYTLSGTNDFASGGYSYRAGTDPLNTIQSNFTYKAGLASYNKTFGSGRNRWGDYSMTSVDPIDGSIWTLQEWAQTGNNWGTVWANLAPSSPGCTDNFEPNDTRKTAAPISVNTDYTGLISSATDQDWYIFSNTASEPNIQINLTDLPADYDVILSDASLKQKLASSKNRGTLDEQINYNNGVVGNYNIRVLGFEGAFDATNCYTLNASISSTPFKVSEDALISANVDSKFIRIYPNPNNGNMTVEYTATDAANAQLSVYDVMGKLVYTKSVIVVEGSNSFNINPVKLSNGLYVIEVKSNDEIDRSRVMVQK